VITTAEIPLADPAVVAARAKAAGRREPAPVTLRLIVWVLVFVFLLALVGLVVERSHPTWLAFMRHTVTPTSIVTTAPVAATAATSAGGHLERATGSTYLVPATTYQLEVTTTVNCWTLVKSPPSSTTTVFAATVTAKTSPQTITVSGTSSIELGARATSITVRSGGRALGVISSPVVGTTYVFEPKVS
jgi:hypothetical protein